jgi:hypothetical protein
LQHLAVFNCLLPVICCIFNPRFAKVILKHQTLYMNTRILLLVLSVAALSSCSSVYKSGQTPDDVYFSPARPQADSYVEVRQEKQGSNYQTYEQYQDSYRDDRFLRMSVGNPYYLNTYNTYSGFDWRYNSFYDGFSYGYNSPWNNYFAWNSFYNPFCSPIQYYGGGFHQVSGYGGGAYYGGGSVHYTAAPISKPIAFDVRSYSNNSSSNRPVSRNYTGSTGANVQRYNNTNAGNGNRTYYNNSSNGSGNRSSYTPSNSSSGNSNNTPSRSYTPSSSSGSSSSGSSSGSSGGGGGGGGVSRPARGN